MLTVANLRIAFVSSSSSGISVVDGGEDDNHVASPESDSVAACRGSLRVETLNPVNILMLMLCLYSRSPSEVMMLTLQPSSTAQRRVLPRPSPFPCKGSRHESDLRVVSRTQPQFLCSTVHTLKGTPALFTSDTHLHHHTWLTAPCHVFTVQFIVSRLSVVPQID